jgi:hypothetical protein
VDGRLEARLAQVLVAARSDRVDDASE